MQHFSESTLFMAGNALFAGNQVMCSKNEIKCFNLQQRRRSAVV